MNCQECVELLNEYALGILDPVDAKKVSEHIDSGCESCRENLCEIDMATAVLSSTVNPISPPKDLKGQLVIAIREKRVTEGSSPTVAADPVSGEPDIVRTTLRAKGSNQDSAMSGRSSSSLVAMSLAASLLCVALSYQAVMAIQRYRWDAPRGGENRIDGFQMTEKIRSRSTTDSLRFVSVPMIPTDRDASPIARAGFVAVDAFAKELHVAIDFRNLPASNNGIICDALTTDGRKHRLGIIKRTKETMALGVFDISVLSAGIVKLVLYENEHSRSASPSAFEMLIELLDGTVSTGSRK